ncbi:hypothetical protein SY88_22565 [Clostridiales bacterium PH28_bin88]|nr:hypothetical protein SY88_22565 [Clostridiales bacterium PH28_bin88]
MVIKCGIDLVEINQIRKAIDISGERFIHKIYCPAEIKYCESKGWQRYQGYAARFAAKEAVAKAIGLGFSQGVSCKEIEVTNDTQGKPCVILRGLTKEIAEAEGIMNIQVSLSHSNCHAIAMVVCYDNSK